MSTPRFGRRWNQQGAVRVSNLVFIGSWGSQRFGGVVKRSKWEGIKHLDLIPRDAKMNYCNGWSLKADEGNGSFCF
jgi:hypothetical protein